MKNAFSKERESGETLDYWLQYVLEVGTDHLKDEVFHNMNYL